MSSPQTTTNDLQAVAEALRAHDRFVLTTHENPDGDALGSLLALNLALKSLGKDVVMAMPTPAPRPAEYGFMDLSRGAARVARRTSPSASSSPSTARTRAASPTPRCWGACR